MTTLPDDLLVVILSEDFTPIERILSKDLKRRIGGRLDKIRGQRAEEILAKYECVINLNPPSIIHSGDVETLMAWYYYHRIPKLDHWEKNRRIFLSRPEILGLVIRSGHLDLLRWLFSIGIEWQSSNYVAEIALKSQDLNILKWLHSIGIKFDNHEDIILNPKISLLRWLHSIDVTFNYRNLIRHALQKDRAPILKFIRSTSETKLNYRQLASRATYECRLQILIWLHSLESDLLNYQKVATVAAQRGELRILKWLAKIGAEIDYRKITNVADRGELRRWIKSIS